MRYKTFEKWMKDVKNIDVSTLRMPTTPNWDRYLDEYNRYKKDQERTYSSVK